MDSTTLADLISERHATLVELLDLSKDQVAAIKSGRMTDLMSILSTKQRPIKKLSQITESLRPALADKPDSRAWPDPSRRERCREQQNQCEMMHAKLLEIEAACEALLEENRTDMTQRLERLSSGTDATSGYSRAQSFSPQSSTPSSSGSQLDLSSN
ncbi:FlgN protein [Rubripirellula obstinata]|uniref:FlgN protein n=1 Tax=Rubripirellula obstinata TaxID=406547 RepID=A0A5B1CLP3_9BACT|nr:flagellar export chaperone FlgN [Rubripirellula obstinata]KAA1260264.1 FlgN protein [Rubripirellula obstinata]